MLARNDLLNNDETGLNHGGYGSALFDPRWKERRKEILKRDNYRCAICRTKDNLEVHHRQYHFSVSLNVFKNPWEYESNLMITLCKSCHEKGHRLYKVPTRQVK